MTAVAAQIDLIVGLGNPGPAYERTRHNAGFWLVDAYAQRCRAVFKSEARFHGDACKALLDGHRGWLLKPSTYMNRCGQSVISLSKYYKIPLERILVVHDELDLPPGVARFKKGGGHGGHNGLRDIIKAFGGNNDFMRLRLGIGHPGQADQVADFVLDDPSKRERELILDAIDDAIDVLPMMVEGELEKAMNRLHSKKPAE